MLLFCSNYSIVIVIMRVFSVSFVSHTVEFNAVGNENRRDRVERTCERKYYVIYNFTTYCYFYQEPRLLPASVPARCILRNKQKPSEEATSPFPVLPICARYFPLFLSFSQLEAKVKVYGVSLLAAISIFLTRHFELSH